MVLVFKFDKNEVQFFNINCYVKKLKLLFSNISFPIVIGLIFTLL